jgi:hypothetical protein
LRRMVWRRAGVLALLLVAGCDLDLPTGDDPPVGQGVISGTITDTANVMVLNATIAVRGTTSRNIVAAAGVYAANELPAGSYTVTVVPPQNYEVATNTNGTVPVEIVASETKTVNFRLRRVANSQTVPPQARE